MAVRLDFIGGRGDLISEAMKAYWTYLTGARGQLSIDFGSVDIPEDLNEMVERAQFCVRQFEKEGAVAFG